MSPGDQLGAPDGGPSLSVTEAIREAIEQHISTRAADEEFRARLAASMERHQRILDRLSKA